MGGKTFVIDIKNKVVKSRRESWITASVFYKLQKGDVFFSFFFNSFFLFLEEGRGKMFACAWLV